MLMLKVMNEQTSECNHTHTHACWTPAGCQPAFNCPALTPVQLPWQQQPQPLTPSCCFLASVILLFSSSSPLRLPLSQSLSLSVSRSHLISSFWSLNRPPPPPHPSLSLPLSSRLSLSLAAGSWLCWQWHHPSEKIWMNTFSACVCMSKWVKRTNCDKVEKCIEKNEFLFFQHENWNKGKVLAGFHWDMGCIAADRHTRSRRVCVCVCVCVCLICRSTLTTNENEMRMER